MKHLPDFIFLFLCMIILSCSSEEIQIPPGVLPKEKMVQVLTDVQITEAAMIFQNSKGGIAENRVPDYYTYIFKKHKITEKQFRESFNFYVGQVELMDKMYEEVIIEISKRQAEDVK